MRQIDLRPIHSTIRGALVVAVLSLTCSAHAADPQPFTILDAVRSTVALHPLLKAAEEDMAANSARQLEANGAFDLRYGGTAIQSRTYTPLSEYDHALALATGINTFSDTSDSTYLSAQAYRLFRNGISISPLFDLSHVSDNLYDIGGINRGRLSFLVNVPLLRSRGRETTTTLERVAAEDIEAGTLETNETIASFVEASARAYWDYLAALRAFEIRLESERRGAEFLSSVRTLIAAGRMPGVESHQAIANLDAQTTARIAAQQQIVEARQNLGYAMGLSALDTLAIGKPADSFPEPPAGFPELAAHPEPWLTRALSLRAGYLATEKRDASADTLRLSARNQLLPQLDVYLRGGYSGLAEGVRPDQFLYGLASRVQGPDVSTGITYSFTRGNRLAQGQAAEAEAKYRKALYLRSDTANRIASSVLSALSGLDNSAASLEQARRAVAEYQSALEGAREQLRLAAGSLLDLLTIEARLTVAQLDLANAQADYARAILQLRYASGTMLGPDSKRPVLESQVFFVPPTPPEVAP